MRTKLCLLLVIFLATILRLYKISEIPYSLYWDESAVAYNAYSIAETGKDEYGTTLPIIFRSFNDYKMPGFVYLTAPFVKFFGLNEFAVRLPSAVSGIITVAIIYFLVRELTLIGTISSWVTKKSKAISLLTAFGLAVSPWHLQFSRTGFEANVASTFFLAGLWLFLRFIRTNRLILLPWLLFAASFYFYRSIHGFLPLFLPIMVVIFPKNIYRRGNLLPLATSIAVFIALISPIIYTVFFSQGAVRFQQVSILSHPSQSLARQNLVDNPLEARAVRYGTVGQDFFTNYIAHFTPKFLFFEGDSFARHKIAGMGLLYLAEFPLILFGLFVLIKFVPSWKVKVLAVSVIMFGIVPASISTPSPHALRSLNVLPMPQFLSAIATIYFLKMISFKKFLKVLGYGTIVILFFFSIRFYLNSYYIVSAKEFTSIWADGYKQLSEYVFANENQYDKVLVTGHYWQPYIYFAFYKKYDPSKFQISGSQKQFSKYLFGPTGWDDGGNRPELESVDLKKFAQSDNILVALSPGEFNQQSQNLEKLTEIRDHKGDLVFVVGKTK